ncbi:MULTISPECIES: class I SAM-dependent methyltransferase [Paracoccus]|uniref:class I SAM-dependent methyltransferase n=1 Tax=Paracoccus TaxID=265 RepID=UPI002589EEE2|nr:class I SAM-dependent methyltransferase [Paracoccus sp. (in: a-proteobacteria)]
MDNIALSEKEDLHNQFGETEEIGGNHYRAYVGPPNYYDLIGATQFYLLTLFGMRETSSLLDIGCGSLRGGRFAIMYLRPGRYYGIDPEEWAIRDGLKSHFNEELVQRRKPNFVIDGDFAFTKFGRKFDLLMAHSIFTHAPQWQIAKCMAEAKKVMVPQTVFLATFFETLDGSDYQGDAWLYPDIVRYRRETIAQIVHEAGLECHHVEWPHPFNQKWIAVTLPGAGLDVARALSGQIYSYEATLERRRTDTTWPGSATN